MRYLNLRSRFGRRGNVVLLVALAAVPLLGMVALATDFGLTSDAKSKLDLAADSAALLATTAASNAWNAGHADAAEEGEAAGLTRFQAQIGSLVQTAIGGQPRVVVGPVNVEVVQQGGLFNATVNYTASETTTFARVLGFKALPISGSSHSSLSLNPYVDIQILMDVSSSMAVAATPADIARMQTLTTNFVPKNPNDPKPGNADGNCAFACHWSPTNDDFYQLAIDNNVQLRITVLQQAVTGLINTLIGLDSATRFRLGLYTFSQQFHEITPLSYDIASETASVGTIIPDINDCSSNCPDTYFSKAMTQLTALDQAQPQQGDKAPQRFLFVVTDGVYDEFLPGYQSPNPLPPHPTTDGQDGRPIGAFDPADCASLKAMGVNILVLYTPYLPLTDNGYYNSYVAPISPQIVPSLQACASSPNYFFVASDATAIKTQMQNMLQLVIRSTSHLTN